MHYPSIFSSWLSSPHSLFLFFFFNDTATTEIYTLSLHDALPISAEQRDAVAVHQRRPQELVDVRLADEREPADRLDVDALDRQPGLQRGAGKRERQARGEAQQKKKKDPLAAKNRNQSA